MFVFPVIKTHRSILPPLVGKAACEYVGCTHGWVDLHAQVDTSNVVTVGSMIRNIEGVEIIFSEYMMQGEQTRGAALFKIIGQLTFHPIRIIGSLLNRPKQTRQF